MSQLLLPLPRPLRSAHAEQAGFTLVELMVAMTGGLFLSIVVFALSRDATRFYQSETRAANATLAGVTGFERLYSDISRAGHLATPNITSDPRVCNRPVAGWPDRIFSLRAVRFAPTSTDLSSTELSTTGITPMAIEVAGALDRSEELLTNHVGPEAGGGYSVTIRNDSPAAARLGIKVGSAHAAANKVILENEFMPGGIGRAVRIAQVDGMEQYGHVSSVDEDPTLRIILEPTPALVFRSNDGVQCGLRGFSTGASINAIQFVRYELRSMVTSTAYASLFNASSGGGSGNVPFELGRLELIREELDPAGDAMPDSIEIISEYAADLQFSLLRATGPTTPALIAATPVSEIDFDYDLTQLLRGIHVRLSVRSREVDRYAPVTLPDPAAYRVCMKDCGTAQEQYARVRTFQADVPLRNLGNVNW